MREPLPGRILGIYHFLAPQVIGGDAALARPARKLKLFLQAELRDRAL